MAYASQLCSTCDNKREDCYCAPNSVCESYKEENFLAELFNKLNIKDDFDKACVAALVFACYNSSKSDLTANDKEAIINKLIDRVCTRHTFDILSLAAFHKEVLDSTMARHLNLEIYSSMCDDYILDYIKEHEIVPGIKVVDSQEIK